MTSVPDFERQAAAFHSSEAIARLKRPVQILLQHGDSALSQGVYHHHRAAIRYSRKREQCRGDIIGSGTPAGTPAARNPPPASRRSGIDSRPCPRRTRRHIQRSSRVLGARARPGRVPGNGRTLLHHPPAGSHPPDLDPARPAWHTAAPAIALPVISQAKEEGRGLALMPWGSCRGFRRMASRPPTPRSTHRLKAFRPTPHVVSRSRRVAASCRRRDIEWTGPRNDRQPRGFARRWSTDGPGWDRWRSRDERRPGRATQSSQPDPASLLFSSAAACRSSWCRGRGICGWKVSHGPQPRRWAGDESVPVGRPVSKAVGNANNNNPQVLA